MSEDSVMQKCYEIMRNKSCAFHHKLLGCAMLTHPDREESYDFWAVPCAEHYTDCPLHKEKECTTLKP